MAEVYAGPVAKWTVMVFMNGDNELEPDAIADFEEMARVVSNPDVNIVVQFDRIPGYSNCYGDWTQTLRFCVKQKLSPTKENAVEDIGEANMGDGIVLSDFVRWAKAKYPAEHYMLDIWSHGQGWRMMQENALLSKRAAPQQGSISNYRSINMDYTDCYDKLYNSEIQDSLAGEKIDLIGFDACLMSMVETAYAVRNIAAVFVGSEEEIPGTGWQYDDWLGRLCSNPSMSPQELGKVLVESYQRTYTANIARVTSSECGDTVVNPDPKTTTLAAVDLSKIDNLARAITTLSDELVRKLSSDLAQIKRSREQCAIYAPDMGTKFFHIDFAHFCERLAANSADPEIRRLALAARDATAKCVIANYAGTERRGNFGSNGIAIYFPENKTAYDNDKLEEDGYIKNNKIYPVAFVKEHDWANFLHAYFDKVP
jgi:clostripain